IGYAIVQNAQVDSYDLQGNLVGTWHADTPLADTGENLGDALSEGQSTSLWKKLASGLTDSVRAFLPALPPGLSLPAYIRTLINRDPKLAIAEANHSDNERTNPLVTIHDYVGTLDDGNVDYGDVYDGESASTFVTLANYTQVPIKITGVKFT